MACSIKMKERYFQFEGKKLRADDLQLVIEPFEPNPSLGGNL